MENEHSILYSMLENAQENGISEIKYSGIRFTVDFEKLKLNFPTHEESTEALLEESFTGE